MMVQKPLPFSAPIRRNGTNTHKAGTAAKKLHQGFKKLLVGSARNPLQGYKILMLSSAKNPLQKPYRARVVKTNEFSSYDLRIAGLSFLLLILHHTVQSLHWEKIILIIVPEKHKRDKEVITSETKNNFTLWNIHQTD